MKKPTLTRAYHLVLLSFSILLYFLSMPGADYPWLAWLILVPVWPILRNVAPLKAALALLLLMTACYLIGISWFAESIESFSGLHPAIAWIILLVFCSYLALPYAISGFLISRYANLDSVIGNVVAAAMMTLCISIFPSPLPGNFAHSLYVYPHLIQIVDFGGVESLFFALILFSLCVASALNYLRSDRKRALNSAVSAVAVLLIVLVYGVFKLDSYSGDTVTYKTIKIGLVQPQLNRDDSVDPLFILSRTLVEQTPDLDLLVWPEIPSQFSYADNRQDRRRVNTLIKEVRKPLIMVSGYDYAGSVSRVTEETSYRNTAHYIDENSRLVASYSKQILVPFFEYLPGEEMFSMIRELFPNVLRYVPGKEARLFEFDDKIKLMPLICYETIFSDLTRAFINEGGNFIINLSNDIWLGETNGSNYHFALGMFRAVEYRVPWVRATNSGISGVVTASGRIDDESLTPINSQGAYVYEVALSKRPSFYANNENAFLYVLTLIVICGLVLKRWGTSKLQAMKVKENESS